MSAIKKLGYVLLWVAGFGMATAAAGAGAIVFLGSPTCGNRRVSEARSPGGTHAAVVFSRDCGATTGFSTQVSVLPAGERLANEAGNVFVADPDHGRAPAGTSGGPDVHVLWRSERAVLIRHHPLARVFRAEARHGDVQISYERR